MTWWQRRVQAFGDRLAARFATRPPDLIVGSREDPYLLRWYLLGGKWIADDDGQRFWWSRNVLGFRPYLHCFLRSDDDRALHDHPASSISIGLSGTAVEHTIAAGGVHRRRTLVTGQLRLRSASFAHRIEIEPGQAYWTLFVFWRKTRTWGFHCKGGWVPWREFVASDDRGAIGRGCGEG